MDITNMLELLKQDRLSNMEKYKLKEFLTEKEFINFFSIETIEKLNV